MPICLRLVTQDSRCRSFPGFAVTGVLLAAGGGVLLLVVGAVSASLVDLSPQPVIATSADKASAVWIVCLIFIFEKLIWVWRSFFMNYIRLRVLRALRGSSLGQALG